MINYLAFLWTEVFLIVVGVVYEVYKESECDVNSSIYFFSLLLIKKIKKI